jgi:hypothetical protein
MRLCARSNDTREKLLKVTVPKTAPLKVVTRTFFGNVDDVSKFSDQRLKTNFWVRDTEDSTPQKFKLKVLIRIMGNAAKFGIKNP